MIFNNGINHRPFFETTFLTRNAPFNYGDTFIYNGMKYLAQDYEYNVLKDEIHGKIIRPIGDCEYSHKAEFWDVSQDGDDIGPILTKRYTMDSSACADVVDIVKLGQFFEFGTGAISETQWKEVEGAGSDMIQVPFGEFFDFNILVSENRWREAEGNGTELSVLNFGQFIEFGFGVSENLWKEAEGAGSDMNYGTPYGYFFEFEFGMSSLVFGATWTEVEMAGRNADFNEEFNSDFDSIE